MRVPVSQIEIVQAKGIDWIREAIAEKLQREAVITISAEAKAIQRLDRLNNQDNYRTYARSIGIEGHLSWDLK